MTTIPRVSSSPIAASIAARPEVTSRLAFDDFKVGDMVEHSIFGTGKIMVLSGTGFTQDPKATKATLNELSRLSHL